MTQDELQAELDKRLALASALEAQLNDLHARCVAATAAVQEVVAAMFPPELLQRMEGK